MKAEDWIKVDDRLPEYGEDVLVVGYFNGVGDMETWKNISEELPRKGTQCEIITKYNGTLIATYCYCNGIYVFRGEQVYCTIDDVTQWRICK